MKATWPPPPMRFTRGGLGIAGILGFVAFTLVQKRSRKKNFSRGSRSQKRRNARSAAFKNENTEDKVTACAQTRLR